MSNPYKVVRDFEEALCGWCKKKQVNHKRRKFCSHSCAAKYREKKFHVPAEERFWFYVSKSTGCWLWKGATLPNGYGQFTLVHGISVKAHRYSYELENGKIPRNLFVCHSCDVKNCVNPKHLWLGTNADNQRDSVSKGRHTVWNKGIRHGKLAV